MRKIYRLAAAVAAAAAFAAPAAAQWKPERPITIIVPWAAGGSTDQVTRVTAAELEKALGQKVVIVNQPGASGSIGTQNALNAPPRRLYLDRRRRAGPWRVQDARHGRHQHRRLEPFPHRRQRAGGRRQRELAVPEHQPAPRRDEGQARSDLGCDGGRDLRRAQRDGGDLARHRREVPPRDLRWRQSRGGGHRLGRDRSHHAARGGAGRDDPRQAHPAARDGERQADRDRGLRRDRADHQGVARLPRAGQLFRHLRAQGRAARSGRHAHEGVGGADRRRARRCASTRPTAARSSAPPQATPRRRPRSRRCRPTRGCCSTAARRRCRPIRWALRSRKASAPPHR